MSNSKNTYDNEQYFILYYKRMLIYCTHIIQYTVKICSVRFYLTLYACLYSNSQSRALTIALCYDKRECFCCTLKYGKCLQLGVSTQHLALMYQAAMSWDLKRCQIVATVVACAQH